jgi:hypothetical protein
MESRIGRPVATRRVDPMMPRIAVRVLHLVMALYLAASAIELLDRSGLADDHAMVGETAQTLRDVRSGDDPFGVADEIERTLEAVRRLADTLRQAGDGFG